jgi:hypothetical protein
MPRTYAVLFADQRVEVHSSAATLPESLKYDWNSDLYDNPTIICDVQLIRYWLGGETAPQWRRKPPTHR